jgi:hypothetical protein
MKSKMLKWAYVLMAVVFFSACSDDDEGTKDVRDDYVGSYRVNYQYVYLGQNYQGTYTLTITKSSTNANDVILGNIDNSNESARATVSGNAITIPQQTISDIGISGSGTLTGNVLSFSTMETQTGGTQINITQTGTRQ